MKKRDIDGFITETLREGIPEPTEVEHPLTPTEKFTPPGKGIPEWRHRPEKDEITEIRWLLFKRRGVLGNLVFLVTIFGTIAFAWTQRKDTLDYWLAGFRKVQEVRKLTPVKNEPFDFTMWPKTAFTGLRHIRSGKRSSLFEVKLDRSITVGHIEPRLLEGKGRRKNERWLLFDVVGVTEPLKKTKFVFKDRRVTSIRVGKHEDPPRVRFVFQMKAGYRGNYDYAVNGRRVSIWIQDPQSGKQQPTYSKEVRNKLRARAARKANRAVLVKNTDRFQICYEGELQNNIDLYGSVYVSFVVDKEGRATNVKFKVDKRMYNRDLVGCLGKEIRRLRFPKPSRPQPRFSYPLRFKPVLDLNK